MDHHEDEKRSEIKAENRNKTAVPCPAGGTSAIQLTRVSKFPILYYKSATLPLPMTIYRKGYGSLDYTFDVYCKKHTGTFLCIERTILQIIYRSVCQPKLTVSA